MDFTFAILLKIWTRIGTRLSQGHKKWKSVTPFKKIVCISVAANFGHKTNDNFAYKRTFEKFLCFVHHIFSMVLSKKMPSSTNDIQASSCTETLLPQTTKSQDDVPVKYVTAPSETHHSENVMVPAQSSKTPTASNVRNETTTLLQAQPSQTCQRHSPLTARFLHQKCFCLTVCLRKNKVMIYND